MSRNKDVNWDPEASKCYTWENIPIYILQDIRDELKELNATMRCLRCPNFLRIPGVLDRIAFNTKKRRKKRVLKIAP